MIPHQTIENAALGSSDSRLDQIHTFPGPEVSAGEFPHLHPDHTLAMALERMGRTGQHVLPVVSRANVRELIGVVRLEDVLHVLGLRAPRGQAR
jgi:CBS domain-containing protein